MGLGCTLLPMRGGGVKRVWNPRIRRLMYRLRTISGFKIALILPRSGHKTVVEAVGS